MPQKPQGLHGHWWTPLRGPGNNVLPPMISRSEGTSEGPKQVKPTGARSYASPGGWKSPQPEPSAASPCCSMAPKRPFHRLARNQTLGPGPGPSQDMYFAALLAKTNQTANAWPGPSGVKMGQESGREHGEKAKEQQPATVGRKRQRRLRSWRHLAANSSAVYAVVLMLPCSGASP